MTTGEATWTTEQLASIASSAELDIAVERADGTAGRWTPIWAVVVGGQVYVRTWVRRDTGWYGRAVRSGRARIRVPGVERVVTAEAETAAAGAVDAAYREKYGVAGAASMTTPEAVASTLALRLVADA